MQKWPHDLPNFILFMCGWKRALQRCNSDSAKIMNALKMKWGLVPLSSSFLGQEKTKKTLKQFYQKTVNLFQDMTGLGFRHYLYQNQTGKFVPLSRYRCILQTDHGLSPG